MKEQPRYLFTMLGFLGSGKSYVSKWLTPHVGGVYFRADALRLAMFGEDRPELYEPENKALVNNANRYAVGQVLESGMASVVYDANNNARAGRLELAKVAEQSGALAITVFVDTPLDAAEERTKVREVTEGHKLFAPDLVKTMAARLEAPAEEEPTIRIDGLMTVEEQRSSFDEQFAQLKASRLQ